MALVERLDSFRIYSPIKLSECLLHRDRNYERLFIFERASPSKASPEKPVLIKFRIF